MSKKVMLIIMDGWGHGKLPASDAIANAKVPFVSSLYGKYPNTELITCGEDVGLPEGQWPGLFDGAAGPPEYYRGLHCISYRTVLCNGPGQSLGKGQDRL